MVENKFGFIKKLNLILIIFTREMNLIRYNIFQAIKQSPYNSPEVPGAWTCWISDFNVYGKQMQALFCLKCGAYKWLNYKECPKYYRYTNPSPNEPSVCQCGQSASIEFKNFRPFEWETPTSAHWMAS